MTTRRALVALAALVAVLAGQGCGSSDVKRAETEATTVALPTKALSLVVNPKTGAVLAETGAGVFLLPGKGERAPRKVRAVLVAQGLRTAIDNTLTLAYTSDGNLVGSSHANQPDERIAANLGLLVSTNGGAAWYPISLYDASDLHILRPDGASMYAVDFARNPIKLLVTSDYGRTWVQRTPPGAVTDIAADPKDPQHAVAVTDNGLNVTHDLASSWRPTGEDAAAVAWPSGGPLYLGAKDGSISASADGDAAPKRRGSLGTGVVALATGPRGGLWALGADRTVSFSSDGGRHWAVRYRLHEAK
ncbi:MAG: hypothetical protein QOG15_447 [Solirubrobacteraceae bacterium]|jgi:hypothetical protein|nr:hypothetical protein [Solirubrobacteraceae bacterium]